MTAIDDILAILRRGDERDYGSDNVDQLAHALQCARLAELSRASAAMIAAALLHDIGHLVNPEDRASVAAGRDAEHERIGETFLSRWFDDDVVRPVRHHVDAKRYLCAVEPAYAEALSEVSKRTLELQGGAYSAAEAAAFIKRAYATDAVTMRRWDDAAKVAGVETPDLEHFRPCLEASLRPELRR